MLQYNLKIGNNTKQIRADLDLESGKGTIETGDSKFQIGFQQITAGLYRLTVSGQAYNVRVDGNGKGKFIFVNGNTYSVEDVPPLKARPSRGKTILESPGEVTPPMPSVVVRVLVKEGDHVEKGQGLVIVTAMKMETTLKAPYSGTIRRINTAPEAKVMPGDILVEIEPEEQRHE